MVIDVKGLNTSPLSKNRRNTMGGRGGELMLGINSNFLRKLSLKTNFIFNP